MSSSQWPNLQRVSNTQHGSYFDSYYAGLFKMLVSITGISAELEGMQGWLLEVYVFDPCLSYAERAG